MIRDQERILSMLPCGSLMILGFVAFWPALEFGFVNWDDSAYVLENPLIKSWSPTNLGRVATETVTRNFAPLTITSLLLDHTVWGLDPTGYHATNVLLHVANGVLVYFLLQQLTGSLFAAWCAAALFLVHPVQIETVAWVSSRKGLLSALFMLAALKVRLKPDADATSDGWYILWLGVALLSKALAVVLPPIVLSYDVWIRRRTFSEAMAQQIIPGMLCLILLLKTMSSQHSILGGVRGHLDYGLLHILAIDTTILWRYIGMLCWPADLSILYNPPTVGIWKLVLAASAAWALVVLVIWRIRKRYPLILWGAVVYLLLLIPVLNFFRITTLMNDRYLYLPCMIFFAIIAGILESLSSRMISKSGPVGTVLARIVQWSIPVMCISAAFIQTSRHLPVWTNSTTLWTHAMTTVPELPVVRIQMAITLHGLGEIPEAISLLRGILDEMEPDELDQRRIRRMLKEWGSQMQQQRPQAVSLP